MIAREIEPLVALMVGMLATMPAAADTRIVVTAPIAAPGHEADVPGDVPHDVGDVSGGVIRTGLLQIDPVMLDGVQPGRRLRFELFDDAAFDAVVHDRRDLSPGRFTISGSLAGEPETRFQLAVNRGAVAGILMAGDAGVYRIRSDRAGLPVAQQIDPGVGLSCIVLDAVGPAALPVGGPCDDGSVIDVLVVYTTAARDEAGGIAAIEAEIDLAVGFNNGAYADSEIASSWNLVHVRQLEAGADPSLSELADPDDGVVDGVHALRDAYGADAVGCIVDGGGGVAYGLYDLDPGSPDFAFNVSGLGSMPSVLAHEIGHNLGCCHALGDGGGCPAEGGLLFPYSNGHRFVGDSGEQWRTIMAYPPGSPAVRFSNPQVLFDGQPTGVSQGDADAADNADTINQSRVTVANYRCNDGICEALGLPSDAADCTGNGVPDGCDIALGMSADVNGNGVPDECEGSGDLDGDGVVGILDLLALLASWGPCPDPCPPSCAADPDGDCSVGISDLLLLLGNWT